MDEPLRAAVIGAGTGGTLSVNALVASPLYRLVAVADGSEAARQRVLDAHPEVATFAGHEQLLADTDLDVVCVSTYAPTHLPIVRDAIEAGVRGLLAEKPLADTAADGARLLELAAARDLPLVVPHGLMSIPAAQDLATRLRTGDLGRLRLVAIECTGWDVVNAGIHWLQYALTVLGPQRIRSVLTGADTSTRTYRDGLQVETEAVVVALVDDGTRVVLHTGDALPVGVDGATCVLRFVGDAGMAEYVAWQNRFTITTGDGQQVVEGAAGTVTGHRWHLERLAEQIRTGRRDTVVPDTSLAALELVEAAYASHRTGATVRLGDTRLGEADDGVPEPPQPWDPGRPYSGTGGGRDGRSMEGVVW